MVHSILQLMMIIFIASILTTHSELNPVYADVCVPLCLASVCVAAWPAISSHAESLVALGSAMSISVLSKHNEALR